MTTVNNNFFDDVEDFIQEHKLLCILTLGLAIVAYSLGSLAGRTVSWIKECYNTTEKTNEVAKQALQTNAKDTLLLKEAKTRELANLTPIINSEVIVYQSPDEIKGKKGILLTKNHIPDDLKSIKPEETEFVGIAAMPYKENEYCLHLCPGGGNQHFDREAIDRLVPESIEEIVNKNIKITSFASKVGRHPEKTVESFIAWQKDHKDLSKSAKETVLKSDVAISSNSSLEQKEKVQNEKMQTKGTFAEFKDQLLLELPEYIKSQEKNPTYERAFHPERGKLETLTKEKTNPPIPLNKPPKGIELYSKESIFYGYNAEDIRDYGWGCAWRAMQTSLSHYGIKSTFAELFHLFGPLQNLQRIYKDKYPSENLTSIKPFAPYNLESGWGDPFIGEMMMHFYGIRSDLECVNGIPGCNSPSSVFHNKSLTFSTFKERLIKHFSSENPAPVMLDDGLYTLNIIGIGCKGSEITLWIGDPHIKEGVNHDHEKTEKTPNGLYTITLDENGNQLNDSGCSLNSDDKHQKGNMFNIASSIGLHFSAKRWMALFPNKRYTN